MMLLALVACACPTFEETAVRTTTTEIPPIYAVNQASDALAYFASWTAREGVCVDEIVVQDEVMAGTKDGPVEVGGQFGHHARRIEVEANGDIWWTTIHELCHALDTADELSPQIEELLAPHTLHLDPLLYPTHRARIREAFARACAAGPEGLVVQEAVSEACGTDLVGDRARFLRDVVYPGFPQVGEAEPGEPLDPFAWRPGFALPLIDGMRTLDEGGDEVGFAVVQLLWGNGLLTPQLRVRRYDVDTTEQIDSTTLDLGDEVTAWQAWASLIPTDTGRAWVMVINERYALVDPESGVVLSFPWGSLSATGFVAGGVFYAAATDTPTAVAAWDLATGARLDDLPGPDALGGAEIDHVFALPDGIGVLAGDRLARLSAGEWTVSPPLEGLTWPIVVHDGAPMVRARVGWDGEWQPVRLDAGWTTWTVDPACDAPIDSSTRPVTAGGRTFFLDRSVPDEDYLVSELTPGE